MTIEELTGKNTTNSLESTLGNLLEDFVTQINAKNTNNIEKVVKSLDHWELRNLLRIKREFDSLWKRIVPHLPPDYWDLL